MRHKALELDRPYGIRSAAARPAKVQRAAAARAEQEAHLLDPRVGHDLARFAIRLAGEASSAAPGPGVALDAAVRASMEERFGADFGGVRVHTGARAAESAAELHAHAYTVGEHIVFSAGRRPSLEDPDRGVLAHELAHVVQQRRGGSAAGAEPRAHAAAEQIAMGQNVAPAALGGAPVGLYRQDLSEPLFKPKTPTFEFKLADFMLDVETLDEFVTDSAVLTPAHKKKLDDAVKTIERYRAIGAGTVQVVGHTDAVGSEEHNLELGQKRADAVSKALSERGVEPYLVTTSSAGKSAPLDPTKGPSGKNRRVEIRFKVLPPVAPPPEATPGAPPSIPDLRRLPPPGVGVGNLVLIPPRLPAGPGAKPPPAGPATPRAGTPGDLLKAITELDPVKRGLEELKNKPLKDFKSLPTGEKVLVTSVVATMGGLALGGILSDPAATKLLLDQLNNTEIAIPGTNDILKIQIKTTDPGGVLKIDLTKIIPALK